MGSNSQTLKSPKLNFIIESGCGLFASVCSQSGLRARMSLLRYLKKGSGSVLPSPGGPLSRHMPSSSIASANKEVKSVLECRSINLVVRQILY